MLPTTFFCARIY